MLFDVINVVINVELEVYSFVSRRDFFGQHRG